MQYLPDAIFGQDFLLEHIDKIYYRKQILSTKHSDIQCWVCAEVEMVCRVPDIQVQMTNFMDEPVTIL